MMNIYRYGIVVDYTKPWNIMEVFETWCTDCAIQDGRYRCSEDPEGWYDASNLDKGPRIESGTGDDLEYCTCISISQTSKDKTDINIKELQNKVRDLYIQELQNIIKNCNETINKIERS